MGLSIGLYVLVCVLIPMAVYGVIMWWKHDPCGLLFGSKEYPVTTENGHKRPARNTVVSTIHCMSICIIYYTSLQMFAVFL